MLVNLLSRTETFQSIGKRKVFAKSYMAAYRLAMPYSYTLKAFFNGIQSLEGKILFPEDFPEQEAITNNAVKIVIEAQRINPQVRF